MAFALGPLPPSRTPPSQGLLISLAQTLLPSQEARAWTFLWKVATKLLFQQSSGPDENQRFSSIVVGFTPSFDRAFSKAEIFRSNSRLFKEVSSWEEISPIFASRLAFSAWAFES